MMTKITRLTVISCAGQTLLPAGELLLGSSRWFYGGLGEKTLVKRLSLKDSLNSGSASYLE